MASIDLNADLGEGCGSDEALLAIVSSCNIACGGHAGDAQSMAETLASARRHGVAAGAHPSYPDRDGFGRQSGYVAGDELYESITAQVDALASVAADLGTHLTHLKPHGALYNDAARNEELAALLARVTSEAHGHLALVGPPGSALQRAAEAFGLPFLAEAFVDRAYRDDGGLVPRDEPGALLDTAAAQAQAMSLATRGESRTRAGRTIAVPATTLCLHGDTPGAVALAAAVRADLERAGIAVRAPGRHD